MRDAADLTNLPRFLEHLGSIDQMAADLAGILLDAGGTVRTFWGPEQMDVWELRVQRGEMIARFGVERGYSDGIRIAPAATPVDWGGLRSFHCAIIAWACANSIPLRLDDPDDVRIDLAKHGLSVLDWVGDGHDADVDRVHDAWMNYRSELNRLGNRAHGYPLKSHLSAARAEAIAAMEAAARPEGMSAGVSGGVADQPPAAAAEQSASEPRPCPGAKAARAEEAVQYWRLTGVSVPIYFKLVNGRDYILRGDQWVPYNRYKSGPSWWRLTGEIGADVIDAIDLPYGAPR